MSERAAHDALIRIVGDAGFRAEVCRRGAPALRDLDLTEAEIATVHALSCDDSPQAEQRIAARLSRSSVFFRGTADAAGEDLAG